MPLEGIEPPSLVPKTNTLSVKLQRPKIHNESLLLNYYLTFFYYNIYVKLTSDLILE